MYYRIIIINMEETGHTEYPKDRYALITAGGSGSRMGADVPKQFLEVNGLPILMHTMRLFVGLPNLKGIIITLNPDVRQQWNYLLQRFGDPIPHKVVAGGKTRSESVRNGLMHVPENALVAIHDAVRPFTALSAIEASFIKAEAHGGAIVAHACQDSLRRAKPRGSEGVSREGMYLVQTPQTFKSELIKWAYEMADLSQAFTDDATVYEDTGQSVAIVEGSATNIKITTQADLEYAEFLMGR